MTLPAFLVVPAMTGASALAQQPPPGGTDPGGQGADFGKSSPMGLLLLLLFFIAIVFLIRSMTKHLKRVPKSFDQSDEQSEGKDADAPPEQDEAPEQPERPGERKEREEATSQGRD